MRLSQWGRLISNIISVFIVVVVAGLTCLASLPALAGYGPVVVTTGSMEPSLRPADVVITATPTPGRVGVGTVINYETGNDTRIHRVIAVDADGYRTKGDANRTADSGSVEFGDIKGIGFYLVPLVGYPRMWVDAGEWWKVLVAMIVLVSMRLLLQGRVADAVDDLIRCAGRSGAGSPQRQRVRPMSDSNFATSASVEADGSIALVRIVMAMVGSAVVIGGRSTGGVTSWLLAMLLVLVILAVAAGLSKLSTWVRQDRFSEHFRDVVMQSADSLATLGLVWLMSDVSPAAGWVLLAIPIVISSLRASATGVLAVWAGVSAGYLALLWFDLAQPGREGIGQALVFERPGTLLAVAACVAILTRWLQDGWVRQAEVARESEARLGHIGVIERAGRRMRELDPEHVLTSCLEHAVDLGFDAVTVCRDGSVEECVGDGELVPAGEAIEAEPGLVDLIEWRDKGHKMVFSSSIREPRTGVVISGWSARQASQLLQIEALTLLVGQATVNIEAAQLARAGPVPGRPRSPHRTGQSGRARSTHGVGHRQEATPRSVLHRSGLFQDDQRQVRPRCRRPGPHPRRPVHHRGGRRFRLRRPLRR